MSIIFDPNTERIQKLATLYPKRIEELKQVFDKPSNIYIDYANVIHWAKKLKWHRWEKGSYFCNRPPDFC